MNSPKILFRTSGGRARGKQLGFGHINRCINLASEFSNSKIFFLIEDYGNATKFIKKNGFENITKIRKNSSVRNEINEIRKYVSKKGIDILIVDKYEVNKKFLIEVKKFVKTVVITDLERRQFFADLIVNGFIGYNNCISKNKYGSRCLLGPRYQILKKNFRNLKILKTKKYDLLVTFGGFDENNIVNLFLEVFIKSKLNLSIKLIVGPGAKLPEMIKILKISKNDKIKIVQSVKNMHKEMSYSRHGLCSGGITSYEFACMRIPFAIICQVPHQLITAKEWEKIGAAKNLGIKNKQTGKKILEYLQNISSNNFSKRNPPRKIDGYGAKRVAKEILRLVSK